VAQLVARGRTPAEPQTIQAQLSGEPTHEKQWNIGRSGTLA
jgi:hypothetical protein